MPTFLELFGDVPLREIFADQTEVSIFDPQASWLRLPARDFLQYAINLKRPSYDPVPDNPSEFRPGTTFILAQAHRIWLTLEKVKEVLPPSADAVLLDLGAYPFSVVRAVREYLGSPCHILGTIAQQIPSDAADELRLMGIELLPVNLDPRVLVQHRPSEMTDNLPVPDHSVDVVLFAHVLEHLYHPIQLLKEVFRVLKPGGKLVLTTDHGFLLGGFLNYLNGGRFLHEPIETTAAMVFDEWRGHVRFYTEGDIRTLLEAAGGEIVSTDLCEVLYNSVPEQYFTNPQIALPRWRLNLLKDIPAFRNEILVVAQKPRGTQQPFSPLNPDENRSELDFLLQQFSSGRCDSQKSTAMDLVFGARLLLGRWPTNEELERYRLNPPSRGLDTILDEFLSSPEFVGRPLAAQLERPGASCIVMAETSDGLRFFFSAQDTFVGFPAAIGVFEPEVHAALAKLLKPGMNCLDLGANFGLYSIRMASVVSGSGGRVISFEPDAFNYGLLLRNRAENRMTELITCYQIACGDEDSEVDLYAHANPSNLGGVRAAKSGEHISGDRIGKAPLRKVDSLVPNDWPVGLIKIDVEGYEPYAIRGMRQTLDRWRPTLICEYSTHTLGRERTEALLSEMEANRMNMYEAADFAAGRRIPFEPRPAPQYANVVCIPAEKDASVWL